MTEQTLNDTKTQFANVAFGALLVAVIAFPFTKVRLFQSIAVLGAPLIGFLTLGYWSHQATQRIERSLFHLFVRVLSWYIFGVILYAMAYRASFGLGSQILYHGSSVTNPAKLMYFSIITVSTLGYGDCHPYGAVACFLSCTQVIQFWLYLALAVYLVNRTLKEIEEARNVSGN